MIRRTAIVVGGFGLLLLGVALLVLPGPGIPLVAAGLALLALEFHWARAAPRLGAAAGRGVTPASRGRRIAVGCAAVAGPAGTSVAAGVRGIPRL